MIEDVPDLKGARVTVMGLGLHGGGTGVTAYLCDQGADVTVTDLKSASDLAESIEEIRSLDVDLTLGEHRPEDFSDADLVVVNPAVPLDSPYLDVARDHGVPLESEINLFVKQCSAPIIGVTGTAGKSTTTSMIGDILAARSKQKTWVGGNIGRSLLPELNQIEATHHVVLEISSFQLLHLDRIGWSPSTAVLTNISPNHLDRHGSMDNYVRAKQTILRYQSSDEVAVLNRDDERVSNWDERTAADTLFFSSASPVPTGAWSDGETIFFRNAPDARQQPIFEVSDLPVPGPFNVENAMAAICATLSGPASANHIRTGLRHFEALPHHLEEAARNSGVTFVDDSVATTPESTIGAVSALEDRRTVVIMGGYDKGTSFNELAEVVCQNTEASVVLGDTAERLETVLRNVDPNYPVRQVERLEDAVPAAESLLNGNRGVVLLSPACASFDQFRNYRERGRTFQKLACQRSAQ